MKLFFRNYGQGPPLIILHGLFGISDNWVAVARKLALYYNVYIPDLRNHGQSPQSPVHSYSSMSQDLHEFVEYHQINKAVIIGHSMGGKVAMQFAHDYSRVPEKIIIVDISPKAYDSGKLLPDVLKTMRSIDFSQVNSRKEVEEIVARSVGDDRIRLLILKNLYRDAQNQLGWRPNLVSISDNIGNIASEIHCTKIFRKPVLFIRGASSNYILDADLANIKSQFPLSEIKTIDGAGHWVHADQLERFRKVVMEFLGKI